MTSHVRFLLVLFFLCLPCFAQKVAITFDDLPLNGDLPPGVTRVQIARDTIAILKARHLPAAYGFINGKKLEGNPDAADALKLWAASEPFGNHTYRHLDLNANAAENFEQEMRRTNPFWSCSEDMARTGTGSDIRSCAKETLSRSGARSALIFRRMDTGLRR